MWKLCLICGLAFLFIFGVVEMFMPVNLPEPAKRIEKPNGFGDILHNFNVGSDSCQPTTLAYEYTEADEEWNPEHKAGTHPTPMGSEVYAWQTKGGYGFLAGICGMILFARWMLLLRGGYLFSECVGYGVYGTAVIAIWAFVMWIIVFTGTWALGGNPTMCKQIIYAYRFDLADLLGKCWAWLACGLGVVWLVWKVKVAAK